MFASTRASPASDFLRDTEYRSRSRDTAIGLIAWTFRPVARRHATSRPRLVSIATGIGSSALSPASASRVSSTAKPAASSLIRRLAISVPSPSTRATS
jgi:hypothetical protein